MKIEVRCDECNQTQDSGELYCGDCFDDISVERENLIRQNGELMEEIVRLNELLGGEEQ